MKRMIALLGVFVIMLVGCGKTEVRGPEPVIDESKLPSILFIQRTSRYLGEDEDYDNISPYILTFYDKDGDYYLCEDDDVFFMDYAALVEAYDNGELTDKIELWIDHDDRDEPIFFKDELLKRAVTLHSLYLDGALENAKIVVDDEFPDVEADSSCWLGLYYDSNGNIQGQRIHENERLTHLSSSDDTLNEIYEWLRTTFNSSKQKTTRTTEASPALSSTLSDSISILKITISEIGGEDGRNYTLTISHSNDTNILCKADNRLGKTITYHISDSDYQSITSTDITDYLDKKDELEYDVADWIDCHTEIQYDNGSTVVSDVYIPELWNKINEVMNKYEPLEETSSENDESRQNNISSENEVAIIFDAVWSKLDEISKEKQFSNYSKEEKRDYLIPVFEDFIDKGYITEYHFNMDVHPAMADFDFSCGGKGAIQLEEYRPDEN